ncbi:hypothetical protein BDW62DRAFT_645 [Aspergillus aurantiobrunneus]
MVVPCLASESGPALLLCVLIIAFPWAGWETYLQMSSSLERTFDMPLILSDDRQTDGLYLDFIRFGRNPATDMLARRHTALCL